MKKTFLTLATVVVWFSVVLQFYLVIVWSLDRQMSAMDGIGRFLVYFTNYPTSSADQYCCTAM